MKKGKQTVRLRPAPLPVLAGALAPVSPRLSSSLGCARTSLVAFC